MKRKVLIERIPGPMASLYEKATRTVIDSYYSQVAGEVVSSLKAGVILDLGTGPGSATVRYQTVPRIQVGSNFSGIQVQYPDFLRSYLNYYQLSVFIWLRFP